MRSVVDMKEDLRPLYLTMLALGFAAVLILAMGFALLLRYAPPGQRTGYRARVVAVFAYDPATGLPAGPPTTRFHRQQPFTAQVDWGGLPPSVIVSARWTDSLDDDVGTVGPEAAGTLAEHQVLVPVRTPAEFHANLPGSYTLTVVRYSGGQPVELLASASVVVLRDP
jgi:hypothetical protein